MKFGKRNYRPQVDQMDCVRGFLAMVFGYYGKLLLLGSSTRVSQDDHGWDDRFGTCKGSRGDWV